MKKENKEYYVARDCVREMMSLYNIPRYYEEKKNSDAYVIYYYTDGKKKLYETNSEYLEDYGKSVFCKKCVEIVMKKIMTQQELHREHGIEPPKYSPYNPDIYAESIGCEVNNYVAVEDFSLCRECSDKPLKNIIYYQDMQSIIEKLFLDGCPPTEDLSENMEKSGNILPFENNIVKADKLYDMLLNKEIETIYMGEGNSWDWQSAEMCLDNLCGHGMPYSEEYDYFESQPLHPVVKEICNLIVESYEEYRKSNKDIDLPTAKSISAMSE